MMINVVNNLDENDSDNFHKNECDHYYKNLYDRIYKNEYDHHFKNDHLVLIFLAWVTFMWAVVNGVAPCSLSHSYESSYSSSSS